MNRPLLRIFQTVWRTTKWRVDWQRSSRSGRSIVEGLGADTEDLVHSAIENSRIDSQYTKDRSKKPMIMRLFARLTVFPSMLY